LTILSRKAAPPHPIHRSPIPHSCLPTCFPTADLDLVVTKGADLMWVPIPFDSTFRMAYGRTCYGTDITFTTSMQTHPCFPNRSGPLIFPRRLIPLLSTCLIGQHGHRAPAGTAGVTLTSGSLNLEAKDSVIVTVLSSGSATVRRFPFPRPKTEAIALGRVFIRITWDNRTILLSSAA